MIALQCWILNEKTKTFRMMFKKNLHKQKTVNRVWSKLVAAQFSLTIPSLIIELY